MNSIELLNLYGRLMKANAQRPRHARKARRIKERRFRDAEEEQERERRARHAMKARRIKERRRDQW